MAQLLAASLEVELSPGDIYPKGWDDDRADPFGPVIVMSHGCEIDKSPVILIAALEAAATTDPGLLGYLRQGRVFHGLLLEELPELAWVNLRTSRYVPRDRFLELLDSRAHSMSSEGRLLLATKFFSNMMRALPPMTSSPAP